MKEALTIGQDLQGSADMHGHRLRTEPACGHLLTACHVFLWLLACGFPEGEHLQIRIPKRAFSYTTQEKSDMGGAHSWVLPCRRHSQDGLWEKSDLRQKDPVTLDTV